MATQKSVKYDWFQFLANNRPISKKHLNALRDQFDEYGNITEISPITVNKNGFIIDGQHRFLICKERNLPIYYNEVDIKKEVTPAMNSNQKKWTARDYINFFADFKPEYKLLRRFIDNNEANYYIASVALFPKMSGSRVYTYLQGGKLEISSVLEEAQKRMDVIHEINEIVGVDMTERYARGVLTCLYKENFDINRFVEKLKSVVNISPNLPTLRSTTTADVLRNIETIYNWRTREENTVLLFR